MPHSRDPKAKFVSRLQPLKNGTKASQSLCPWLLQGPVGNRIETTNPVQAKAIFAEKKKLSAQAELKKKKKSPSPQVSQTMTSRRADPESAFPASPSPTGTAELQSFRAGGELLT